MNYTVRYTHLETIPELKQNVFLIRGDMVGRIGNTGASNGRHLHIDCIEGHVPSVYHLWEMSGGGLTPSPKQLNYFTDSELFKSPILITTYYNDPKYMQVTKKLHTAYDVVPENRHKTDDNYDIFWNRSVRGEVLSIGFDIDYGNYIQIGFNA